MLEKIGQQAKLASYQLQLATTQQKNEALERIAEALNQKRQMILSENQKDIETAKQHDMSSAMLDRLLLTPSRLEQIIIDIQNVISLPDPIGEVMDTQQLPSGLFLQKKRVSLGVVGAIYEARPNVTIDIATLCLKTANAVILRGGKETSHTNLKLIAVIQEALTHSMLPNMSIQYLNDPTREYLIPLLKLDKYIDMIVPRGGRVLQRLCQEEATIPVILGGVGVCHIFVDVSANFDMAINIIENAKVQRPSTCNSVETVLIHDAIKQQFLPQMIEHLASQGVTFHLYESDLLSLPEKLRTQYQSHIKVLAEQQLHQEWLSLDLNVIFVKDIHAAIEHIRHYGSHHSDAILTNSDVNSELFINQVDSAAVYVNCSTRFTDGAQYGLGTEVAISTQKLHARGPLGLDALTTYKWIGHGDYLTRG